MNYEGRCFWCQRDMGAGHGPGCPYVSAKFALSLILLMLGAALARAAEPPAVAIRFPDVVAPIPPKPLPDAPIVLPAGTLLVIESDAELMADGIPGGIVSVRSRKGPWSVTAIFVGGTGGFEDRDYAGPFITVVQAIGPGPTTLVLVPVGAKTKAEWVKRSIQANVGPLPPPVPPVPPTPPSPDAALLKAFRDAYAKDVDVDKAASVQKLAAVFRSAAKITAPDPTYKTVKEIDEAIRSASQGQIGVLAIPNVRDAVGLWLRSQLPTGVATPLDDVLRQKYVVVWTAVALALDQVK